MLCSLRRLERLLDDDAQVRLARQDGGDRDEVTLGRVGNDLRQRGLACSRRPPQDDGREQPVRFDGAAQELALADDVLLADIFIQRARAHARGERRLCLHAFLHGMVEKVLSHKRRL